VSFGAIAVLTSGALFALGPGLAAEGGGDRSSWAASYDPATRTRFIPVELWTGGPWNGARELRLTPARLSFGKRGEKTIAGPVKWARPSTGQVIQVYERKHGAKRQLFALSSRKDGLGRVFDSRYGRDCVDEVKFPVGLWKQGETRTFAVSCNGGKLRRTIALTIERIDFVHQGLPHSLQFHWVVDGGKGRGSDLHYVYSPGRGLVSLDED
jgi:hypothetical protein